MSKNRHHPLRPIEADDLQTRQAGPLDRFIGARIQEYRQERRMSYEQLGGMLGFSGQQMRKYERGLSRVPASTLYVIAQILDVPISHLVPEEKTPSDPILAGIQEIAIKLAYIKDRRFLMATSLFISAIMEYSETGHTWKR